MRAEDEAVAGALTKAFVRHGFADARIASLMRLSTGASQDSYSFDVVTEKGSLGQILRRVPEGESAEDVAGDPIGAVFARVFFAAQSVEAALLQGLEGNRAPLPRVTFALDPEDGLGRGFVMDRLPGTAEARKILREDRYATARGRLAGQLGAAAAAIAGADLARLPALSTITAEDWIAGLREIADCLELAHPVVEVTLRWLEENRPPPAEPRLVHGDFRLGNVLVDESGLTGVIDWELAHLGDPVADLGWLCIRSWRFTAPENPAAGVGTREALLSAYEAAGGTADAKSLRFWEVFGNLRWATMCLYQAYRHTSRITPSVELTAVGRRYFEPLYDVIELLEGRDG